MYYPKPLKVWVFYMETIIYQKVNITIKWFILNYNIMCNAYNKIHNLHQNQDKSIFFTKIEKSNIIKYYHYNLNLLA